MKTLGLNDGLVEFAVPSNGMVSPHGVVYTTLKLKMCTSVGAYALTTSHWPGPSVVAGRLFQCPVLGPLRVGSNVSGKLVLFVMTMSTLVQPPVQPVEQEPSWTVAT